MLQLESAPQQAPSPHSSALSLQHILFAVFRHKTLVITCTVLGLIAAAVEYRYYPSIYESQAKLLVRYIVERSSVDPLDGAPRSAGVDTVLGNEAEILQSWDLAVQVAEAVGVQQLASNPKSPSAKEEAAAAVASGLRVLVQRGSNIILIAYQNPKPELTTVVLNELVSRYFVRHLEVHRSAGAFDFVSQQTDQVRARLNQTESALRVLNDKIGIASISDSTAAINSEMLRTEEQLRGVDAEVAEQRARVAALEGAQQSGPPPDRKERTSETTTGKTVVEMPRRAPEAGSSATPTAEPPQAGPEETEEYRRLTARLDQIRKNEIELGARYTHENPIVQADHKEMAIVQEKIRRLERKFPALVGTENKGLTDLLSERAKLAGLMAKAGELKARLQEVRARFKELADATPQIVELLRKKEMEETNLKYFQATLEKARIDEALDPSKIPNISAVQKPSPPAPVTGRRDKIALGLAGGGLGLGLLLALLNDMVLNRTVKRTDEIEVHVGIAPLVSVPYSRGGARLALGGSNGSSKGSNGDGPGVAPWDGNHFIRKYSEAIRDRLGLYFELNDVTHKPKLIGVTALDHSAGVSTLAAGVAAALSEVGDGKVLLVDVNLGPDQVHPFLRGRPAVALTNALDTDTIAPTADNLYLATVAPSHSGIAQLGLKKFFDLMPNLKASDFDYIVFDMPPLSQTSPTVGMTAFMDKVLLVVEAEKNNREIVKRGYAALASQRNNVSVVLNKTRSYLPKWLDSEK